MRVALGVSAGIAAYKAAELVRLLQDRGLEVQVIMTPGAREFVSPLTFAALSGRKVITEMFAGAAGEANLESAIEHIAVAQSIDALVVAPATADVLAKIAHGLADDFLTTLALATRAPLIVAPAMNVNMWENRATQENLGILKLRGVRIVDPEEGYLACGMVGQGRLASLESITSAVCEALGLAEDFKGEKVLVTAGPTEEPVDPVRYLSNRSSGKMGYAIAEAARRRGAEVVLVSGPTRLEPPSGVALRRVRKAEEMAGAVFENLKDASVVVMTAAVADFRAARIEPGKIKRGVAARVLELEPTEDILAGIARRRRPGQIVAGFAAETEQLVENARAKLKAKNLDFVVANDITQEGAGFEVDTNIVTLVFPDGRTLPLERMSKLAVAGRVLDESLRFVKGKKSPGRRDCWCACNARFMIPDHLRHEIAAWLEFYHELGIEDFYPQPRRAMESVEFDHSRPGHVTEAEGKAVSFAEPSLPATPASAEQAAASSRPPSAVRSLSLFEAEAPRRARRETLDEIRDDLGDCRRCKLAGGRKHIVFGQGNPRAELVFVGEGPGADEDEQGLPFVGRAGQLLNRMLQAVGIRREDVYICNVVKCRPPGNRTPERDEVESCSPFLSRQIEAIQPRLVCCLGAPAVKTVLGLKEGILKLRGRFYDFGAAKALATVHPAYVLRNPREEKILREDFAKIQAFLRQNTSSAR